ncbi:thioredoxin domain-containing protein [Colwellia sp. RSH04]|uniref:DsbA family protein n=1 Tax=Colwellia sp. RSH04 TaxID=2305464 RepID=UPI000E586067|nr:thioredoxin domain-containing protein [Colwellia sp. RSH04]RHW77391.1 thioredoxin [Colwellia sp. RSH04]
MNKKILFVSVTVFLLAAFFIAATYYQSQLSSTKTALSEDALEKLVRVGAPMKGNENAKVTIVEFLDPACETCAVFFPFVDKIMKKYPEKLRLVVRYAPLHKGSDKVVRLLEAAHLQNQFWPALELLFAKQQQWTQHHVAQPQIAKDILSSLPLDQKRLAQDAFGKKVTQALNADLADGKTFKVRATPEFFVNGRKMQTFGYEQLLQLINEEMAKHY